MNWDHIERAFKIVDQYGLSLFIALCAIFMVVRVIPRMMDALTKKLDVVADKFDDVAKTIDRNFKEGNQAAHQDREEHYERMHTLVKDSQTTYLQSLAEFQAGTIAAHRGAMERKDQERREQMEAHHAAMERKDAKIYELYDRLSGKDEE